MTLGVLDFWATYSLLWFYERDGLRDLLLWCCVACVGSRANKAPRGHHVILQSNIERGFHVLPVHPFEEQEVYNNMHLH
jgi:predicted CoA-binding protein